MMNSDNIDFPFRDHFKKFIPYSSAREEFTGEADVFIDANESPFENDGKNRYPSSTHSDLKDKIAGVKNQMFSSRLQQENLVLGNGSDELIDLITRLFCGENDEIVLSSPTFGMYSVSANMYQANIIDVPLDKNFQLQPEKIIEQGKNAKLLFICNPNNPTGNALKKSDIEFLLGNFSGMVVVDEAYIEFCSQESVVSWIEKFPRLIVLQTFSKMWGLAGVRCGVAMGHPLVIEKISALKAPYNVNVLTAKAVNEALNNKEELYQQRNVLLAERSFLEAECMKIAENIGIEKIYPSQSNFLLVRFHLQQRADEIYEKLLEEKIIVRNFSRYAHLHGCLRITVGSPQENKRLLQTLLQCIKN